MRRSARADWRAAWIWACFSEAEREALLRVARMAPVDVVLLDGFRRSGCRKMEVVPAGQERPVFAPDDPMVLGVTSEAPVATPLPWLPLADIAALADFVMANAAEAV